MGGAGGTYRSEEKCTQALVRKHEGKRPFGRRRCRWEDIKIDRQETGWEGVDWVNLAQDRDKWRSLVNMVMNLRVLWNEQKCTILPYVI